MNIEEKQKSEREIGFVVAAKNYLLTLEGLPGARLEDILYGENGKRALVISLRGKLVKAMLLDRGLVRPGDMFALREEKNFDVLATGTGFKGEFSIFYEKWVNRVKVLSLKSRIITSKVTIQPRPGLQQRLFSEYFEMPHTVMIYADKVALIFWNPHTAILIKSAPISQNYQKFFNLLWKNSKLVKN